MGKTVIFGQKKLPKNPETYKHNIRNFPPDSSTLGVMNREKNARAFNSSWRVVY